MAAPDYPILGQVAPTGTSPTNLITVPIGHKYIVSTLTINNLTGTVAKASINLRPAGASLVNKHKYWTDVPVKPGRPVNVTFGMGLTATDVVDVVTDTANALTFTALGTDIS